ncbi:cell division cycle protein 27 homolog [Drosophila sulfurigaster albostrigata]|uniref:cell division cycle protein 27 homolog n=1 Tax=Drosophila sulfurigaster albostrigata TaxID=89887 RepID=UPI002D21B3F6|nr:cell division cycle protein 27 homolog [Drosophila sulfurigaster albostrigata]
MMIQEPVQAAIWHCLNHYDHKDAVFLAERLCSEVESDETIFLLATSYYRSNQLHQAYWLLDEKKRRSPQCRYLQAKCAYELKKYAKAESALIANGFADSKHFDELQRDFGELACFAYQLMAQVCMRTERQKLAVTALQRALKLNPFMWHAFADLCLLGQDTDATAIFQIQSTDVFNTCQASSANVNSMVLFNGNGLANEQQQQHLEQLLLNNLSNNSNYIFNTPVDQQQQQLLQQNNNTSMATLQNLMTPNNNINNNINNNNNLNSSITMLRGGVQQQLNTNCNSSMMLLEDTPMATHDGPTQQQQLYDPTNGTPFRRQFKYLSTISPLTPSFGIMPLASPSDGSNSMVALQSNLSMSTTYSPLPQMQMLVEVNQEPKIIGKKLKTHVGGIINRQEKSKPVFTQGGNITPRTSNNVVGNTPNNPNPNAAVRRSSRLFSNSAYSVKENNKSPNITNNNKFVQPRSPPRKTKSSRMPKICLSNELIEEKTHHHLAEKLNEKQSRKEKEKVETITSAATAGNNNQHTTIANNNRSSSEDAKVLLNNSLNNAQTLAHQLLSMKKQSADGLMLLLRDLAEGYKLLSAFHCKAAIKQMESTIPKHHLNSSYVQSLIGMCRYELREYEAAVGIFKEIHDTEPSRLDYMEIYSTSLWHLQKEVALSALAQDLISQDKRSPVTWCVAGNCFSLHKEHETAIKFFKRAVQVDADFVYSYTLLGHELVLTEEFDKAMDYFRSAVVRDPRHYNAWFGIGTIYSKQEKYELAEQHYVKALKINPWNSVILVHIGAMQFFMQKKDLALQTLNTAATLDPKNPLARFHRGSIYFSLGKYQEALRELEELKEIVPKESVVFYLIGKIHKTLGNMDLALMHFSWATDLDPKGANNQIKDAFDSMAHPNCCPATDNALDVDFEPTSDRSDDSTQAQQDVSYDSDF